MLRFMGQIFYVVFHPLLVYGWLMVLCIWGDPFLFGGNHWSDLLPLVSLVLFSTAVIPGIAGGMMKALQLTLDYKMIELRDRIIPLTATAVFYMAFYTNVEQVVDLTPIARQLMLGILITLFVLMFLSPFYQPSIHAAGHATLLTGLAILFYGGTLISLPLAFGSTQLTFYAGPILVLMMLLTGCMGSWLMKYLNLKLDQITGAWMLGVLGQVVAAMWYGA